MRFLLALMVTLALTGCALSANDIRDTGASDTFVLDKEYEKAALCASQTLIDDYDAGLTVAKNNLPPKTTVTKSVVGGGYFIEITPASKKTAKVEIYGSQNMIFMPILSSKLMQVIMNKCS